MKRKLVVGIFLFAVLGANSLMAQEHIFGLSVGSFQFPASDVFTDSHFLIRGVQPSSRLYFFERDMDSADYSGPFLQFGYEWRRDTDSHFSLSVNAGLFSANVTETVPGLAVVPETRGGAGAPPERFLSAAVTNTLDYTLYFVHVTPKYNFTTGKVRFWVGAGAGLWANFWREVIDMEFIDIFSCDPGVIPDFILNNCTGTTRFRESEGDRRTILPITASAGLTVQFLPHWTFFLEDRYLFAADSSLTLFRDDSNYSIGGNQIIIGFGYRL